MITQTLNKAISLLEQAKSEVGGASSPGASVDVQLINTYVTNALNYLNDNEAAIEGRLAEARSQLELARKATSGAATNVIKGGTDPEGDVKG